HAMPLTQILVIDPDERLLYQSERLIAALQADRRSGCPNAVQQLDYGVDLFSLGHIAEKISAAGPLPHDGLIAEIDRLLGVAPAAYAPPDFNVDGEWSAQEMGHAEGAARKTPSTPVALPLPTPVSLPYA